jgi:hypothetical protein
VWIEKQKTPSGKPMSVFTFAQGYGFGFRTIYLMVDPLLTPNKSLRPVMPRLDTLKRIERATGGEVTIQDLLDWYESQPQKETA